MHFMWPPQAPSDDVPQDEGANGQVDGAVDLEAQRPPSPPEQPPFGSRTTSMLTLRSAAESEPPCFWPTDEQIMLVTILVMVFTVGFMFAYWEHHDA
jgi:hypothetical protein